MKKTKRDLTLFRTPFTPSYWRLAFGEFRSLKMLTLTAILVAICGILDIFFIISKFFYFSILNIQKTECSEIDSKHSVSRGI